MRTDLHQHVWTPQLVEHLARRDQLPFVEFDCGLPILHAAGERPYVIDTRSADREVLLELAEGDRVDRIVVAISSPAGIESLPRSEAVDLIDAHLNGVRELGSRFLAWGPLALDEADPDDVDLLAARGCVGVSLPAQAMAGADRLEAAGPLLERVARAGMPLFVHPGHLNHLVPEAPLDEPLWWQAMTSYVNQMQAAWLAFAMSGRRSHPDLVVVFAMLAACAPLQAERLEQRSGRSVNLRDPLTFYDVSSYGHTAVQAMSGLVGSSQLVYGSDRPVVEPIRTGGERLLQVQATQLLARAPQAVEA